MIILGAKGSKNDRFFIKVWRADGTIEVIYENVDYQVFKNIKKYCKVYKVLAIAIANIPENQNAIQQNN